MNRRLAAAWLVTTALLAGAAPPALRFAKDVESGPLSQEEILAVVLDSDVYAGTRDDFRDLRVFDSQGKEVPYVLDKVTDNRSVAVRHTMPARQVSLQQPSSGGLEIRVSRDPKLPPVEGINLATPLANYQQRVQVSGSADGKEWHVLVPEALVFDYSRYLDVSNHQVALPANRDLEFKILIRDPTAAQESQLLELTRQSRGGQETEQTEKLTIERRPFRIDRIEFWYHVNQDRRQGDRKADYAATSFQVLPAADSKQTTIEVSTRREPLTGFQIETSSRNFQRRAVVQVPVVRGVRTDWHDVGGATITRVDLPGLRREELWVSFPESRQERYRIVIENGDNAPLAITGVRGQGDVYRLMFLAAGDGHYRVGYGSEAAQAPSYDTAALREWLSGGHQPVDARLSAESAQPAFAEPTSVWVRGLVNNPFVLGGVILVLVAAVAWGLYRAARRIDQLPQDPGAATS
jgi:hypothetical protein